MATLHLVCGLPGSGKTTFAKRLEASLPALRLCPDEWMRALSLDGYDEASRESIERLQIGLAERALSLGMHVILEFGFWSRRERDELRARAEALGAQARIHFLDVSKDELKARVRARNAALPPDAVQVRESDLDYWWERFEPPTPEELGQT